MTETKENQYEWSWKDVVTISFLWLLVVFLISFAFLDVVKAKPYWGSFECNIFMLIILTWFCKRKNVSWREFGFPTQRLSRSWILGTLIGLSLPTVVNIVQLNMIKILTSVSTSHFFYMIIFPFTVEGVSRIVLSPIVEEIVDRGTLYRLIRRRVGMMGGILMSSFIISLSHISSITNIEFFVIRFFYNVVFCFIYERTGNLLACMSCHMAVNYISSFYRVIDLGGG